MSPTSLTERLSHRRVVILDAGLATSLEDAGHDLGDALWSARLLLDAPSAIAGVHRAHIAAGAEVITTASYQASFEGLEERGCDETAARAVIRSTVELAREARGDADVLVAASIGPFGASLADGSEYTGAYEVGGDFLRAWHERRLSVLSESAPDLLAIETIPSILEAEALVACLDQVPGPEAWVAFSTRDGTTISDGTPIEKAVALVEAHPRVIAGGVNCTAPASMTKGLAAASKATALPLVAYANSGESWDARERAWVGQRDPASYVEHARRWADAGARLIGGCCRTGTSHIEQLATVFG